MTRAAPTKRAPWTALMPMPPIPMTMITSPGTVPAARVAEPHPVGTPQPARHATSSGTSSSILTQDTAGITLHSEKVETQPPWPTSRPSTCMRNVPSSWLPISMSAPLSQRFCWPEAHHRQCPQLG